MAAITDKNGRTWATVSLQGPLLFDRIENTCKSLPVNRNDKKNQRFRSLTVAQVLFRVAPPVIQDPKDHFFPIADRSDHCLIDSSSRGPP
jgi:hypothetical protein